MPLQRCLLLIALCGLALLDTRTAAAQAAAPASPAFDYYVLSLSWSPEYCARARRDDGLQCSQPRSFVVHGLWPQYERGYPQRCDRERQRIPERTIERMLPIMPSRGLVIHEWRSHGSCSGLAPEPYFDTVARAWSGLRVPTPTADPDQRLAAVSLREQFRKANPQLSSDSLRLVCARGYLSEVRICLDQALAPRACGSDVRDRCPATLRLRAPG